MKKLGFILIVAGLIISTLSGCKKDQSTVTGTVYYVDKITGEKKIADQADVYLMVDDSNYVDKTVTDGQGKYQFVNVPDGQYFVEAEKSTLLFDYTGKTETFKVKGDDVVNYDLTLTNKENNITGQAIVKINGQDYTSADVTVYLYYHNDSIALKQVSCDDDGYFVFANLQDGTYDIDAEYYDNNGNLYYDYAENISVTGGETKTVDLTLIQVKK